MPRNKLVYGEIYLGTCSIDNKQYVGQTTSSLVARKNRHFRNARKGGRSYLNSAIRKHGKEAFTFETIWLAFDKESLDNAEDHFIILLSTLAPNGYNLRRGGANGIHSEASRLNISIKTKEAMARQDVRDRFDAAMANPVVKENKRLAAIESNARPGVKEQRRLTLSTPEQRERMRLHGLDINNRPITREKIRIGLVNSWINHDIRERRIIGIKRTLAIPEVRENRRRKSLAAYSDPLLVNKISVLTKEALKDPEKRERMSLATKGTKWINDGTNNRRINKGDILPDEWVFGMLTPNRKSHKGRKQTVEEKLLRSKALIAYWARIRGDK